MNINNDETTVPPPDEANAIMDDVPEEEAK